nr:MAG TPA: tail tape measure [Caudoviricetes sp.]
MSKQVIEERLIKLGIDKGTFEKGLKDAFHSLEDLDKALVKSDKKSAFTNTENSAKSLSRTLVELMGNGPKLGNILLGTFDKVGNSLSKTTSGFGSLSSSILGFISPVSSGTKEVAASVESMSDSVQTSGQGFSMLQNIATVALGNIAASAVQTGISIAFNLGRNLLNTIAPIKQGFGQFEDKINSVNMLVAALGKESMAPITSSLDELQHYAETTKYSVKQMHGSLAQFVNAGVGLNEATTALKGWGNLAASAGASTDGFNRSLQFGVQQALQMGKMNTQNWVSVENAGMATERFKNILLETARAMGIEVDMAEGFHNSLQQGWLTNDVLIKSLETLANDETLSKMAAEFHTLGEVSEAIADQVTSSWARFWETLIGQAGTEEVTAFWTKWGNLASDALGRAGEKATQFAKSFVDIGGRQKIIGFMEQSLSSLSGILKPIGDAFTHVFGSGTMAIAAKKLADLIGYFTEKIKLGGNELKAFENIFINIFQMIKWVGVELGLKLKILETLIPDHMVKNVILIAGMFAKALTKIIRTIEILASKFIDFNKIGSFFSDISDKIHKFWDAIHNGLSGFSEKWNSAFDNLPSSVGKIVDWLKKFWEVIKLLTPAIGEFKQNMRTWFAHITDPFTSLSNALEKNSKTFNEWSFWVGNSLKRFPLFGKQLGEMVVGFSHFNNATYDMSTASGRFGDKMRRNLTKMFHDWDAFSGNMKFNYKAFWVQFNANMDKVLNGQIRTWEDFNKNLNWSSLIPSGIKDMFKGIKFDMPDFGKLKTGLSGFTANPFGSLAKGSADLSKWLENSTLSFKSFGSMVRKTWPSLSDYADELDKVKFSFSFLQPVVDAVGKAFKWLEEKIAGLGFKKSTLDDFSKSLDGIKGVLSTNFADGIVPGIVKSIDGFRKWAQELDIVKATFKSFSDIFNLSKDLFKNIGTHLKTSKVDFTDYKTTLKTFGGWFKSFWLGLGDTVNGSSMKNIVDTVKAWFTVLINWVKDVFGPGFMKFFNGLPEDMQNSLLRIWDGIKKFISDFGDNFKNADFTFKDFGKSIGEIGEGIGKVFGKLIDAFKDLGKAFAFLFGVKKVGADELSPGDFGEADMRKAEDGLGRLESSIDRVNNKSRGVFSSIGDMSKLIGDMFRSALTPFSEGDSATIGKIVTLAAAITVLYNTRKKIATLKDLFGDFTKNLISGPKTVIGSMTGMFTAIGNSFKAKVRLDNVKAMALAIAVLVGSLWLLSTIPTDKLLVGLGGLVGVLVVFEAFYLTLSKTTKKFNPAKVRNMQQAMLGMLGLSGSILLLSASVALIGQMDFAQALQGIAGVGLLLAAIFASMGMMNKLQGNTVRGVQKISVSLFTFFGIAMVIKKIVPAIKDLGEMNFWKLAQGIGGMAAIIAGITAILIATSKMDNTKFSSIFAFSAMAGAIKKLGATIKTLGEMDQGVLLRGGAAVTTLLAVMGGMVWAFGKLGNDTQNFSVNALVMFGGIALVFYTIGELSKSLKGMENPDLIVAALVSVASVVAAMSGLAYLIGRGSTAGDEMSRGIKRLGVIVTELVVASIGMMILSKMNTNLGHVAIAVLSMGAVIGGLLVAARLAKQLKPEGLIGLGVVVGSLVAAAIGMTILTSIPTEDIWTKVLALGAIVAGLTAIGWAIGQSGAGMAGVAVIALGFLALGAGIKFAADAAANFIGSLSGLISNLTNLFTIVSSLGSEGGKNFASFFKEASKGAGDMAQTFAALVTGIVAGFVKGISENIGTIIDIGIKLMGGFLEGILKMASKVAEVLVTVLGEAFEKLLQEFPGWWIKINEAMLEGLSQMAQWIRNNKRQIIVAFLEIMEAIRELVMDMVQVLFESLANATSGIPIIGDKFKDMSDRVSGAFKAMNEASRKELDALKDYPSIATEEGIQKAIDTMDKLGEKEAEAARQFASKGKDGLDSFRIYCAQLGIVGPNEFIKGLQNGSISAKEGGRLLSKMAELGMSESQIKYIAEAAGFDYANGILTAKPKAKENAQDIKKTVEENLTGGESGFDTNLVSTAFEKLNQHLGGQLDVTKALAALKSGEIPPEMLTKLAEGNFEEVSQENMNEYLKPINEMGDKAAAGVDNANKKTGESMDNMSTNIQTKASDNRGKLNGILSDFNGGITGAADGMRRYAAQVGAGSDSAKNNAKAVADGTNKNLQFDGSDPANKSVSGYAGAIGSEGSKSKARGAAQSVNSAAKGGFSNTSGAASSGEAITRAFAGGLASKLALAAIDVAMNAVNGRVKKHQPQSPAKTGVFSGKGWTGVYRSGLAIVKEFAGGLGSTTSLTAIDGSMNRVNGFVKDAMDTMGGYLDENMDMSPTITPVLDMTNLNGYNWSGSGSLDISANGINYASLNPNTRAQASNRYSIDEVVKGLNALDRKLETLAEVSSVGNDLLAQDRVSPVFMDKDLVNRALAPGMAEAQRTYNDRLNMLDGVLPTI